MEKLKEHAIRAFGYVIPYYQVILDKFPEDKLELDVGSGNSPLTILKHVGGTAGWWMKRRGSKFEFSSSVKSKHHFFEVVGNQLEGFKQLLEDPAELYWKGDGESKPGLSIPWIAIRAANHAFHHGAMLIAYRHYYGLPPLEFNEQVTWGKIVDLPGEINYST